MRLEIIRQYWEEAIKLSSKLPGDRLFTTPQFVSQLKEILPTKHEEMTKAKVNYLRTQGILHPEGQDNREETDEKEGRTSWRYTVTDFRRAILIELLKEREDLSVQESKVWLQSLEDAQSQSREISHIPENQAAPPEVTLKAPPTPASSAYALLQNRTLGTLLTALEFGKYEKAPPECLIAIRILNTIPEFSQIKDVHWEFVRKRLETETWSLGVSDSFSKIYVYSSFPQLQANQPDVIDLLPERYWYSVTLVDTTDHYYELLLGLPDNLQPSVAAIDQSLNQRMTENSLIELQKFPGLSTLLKTAFASQLSIKKGTTLSVLAEIIAEVSDIWDYCAILVPETPNGESVEKLKVQEYSTSFPRPLRDKSIDIEKSLTGWCYRHQQKAIVTAMAQNDLRMAFFAEEGRPSVAAVIPAITEEQRIVGVVYVAGSRAEGNFSPELVACLQAFGYMCGDVIAREHVEIETVHNMSRSAIRPPVENFTDLDIMLQQIADEVRKGISPERVDRSWIYLLTLNVQTTSQDIITTWLCQQGVDLAGNFLAYHLWRLAPIRPLPIGLYQISSNQYVYAILQAIDLPEENFKQCIILLQKELDRMRIGRLAPNFYPSGVTIRFKDLSQSETETNYDAIVQILTERTQERLIAGPYFNRGHKALYAADLDQAVSEFEDALRYVPRSWYGHKHVAEARMLQGTARTIEQAIEHCQIAIALNPSYAAAQCLLADCLAYQGKFGEALLAYEKALELESTRSDFFIRYGLTLAGMTSIDYQEAIQYTKQQNQRIQAQLFQDQPWQAAIDKFDQARHLSTMYDESLEKERAQRAQYHYQRGYAYLQANILDKAIEDFTVGKKLAPDDLQLVQAYSYALSLHRKEQASKQL